MKFNIKKARQRAHMSQAALAQKSGVSRTVISGMESGRISHVSTKTLEALSDALGVTVVALLRG